jgi:murein DD-endopeptidase MepM/ murein hydrolase activator NlpD
MKRTIGMILALAVIAGIGAVVWFWDADSPVISVDGPESVGPNATLKIRVDDAGKGLRDVRIIVQQEDNEHTVAEESFPMHWRPWERSESTRTVTISDWKGLGLTQGPFTITVQAEDQPNLWLLSRTSELKLDRKYDSHPPRFAVISRQHYLRQGGSEVVLYHVDEPGRSGVRIGDNEFVGYPVPGKSDGTMVCIFALAYDQSTDLPVQLWAEDEAGNQSETRVPCKTFPQQFRHRKLNISENFIAMVTPEIFSRTESVQATGDPLKDFLAVNRDLRVLNNQQISEITRQPSPELYWKEPFLQLTNSKVEAVFADHRSYYFKGEKVDEQVHLGFDLASLAQADVEASNAGRVVWADYLGIYGNAVILDHGLGLFSLYGHLSSIGVQKDQIVGRGETLGRTGQTGLAGGDHLHFSMLVQGVQVNPVEWWDPAWIENHFLSKVR